jgi:hypothetical protein
LKDVFDTKSWLDLVQFLQFSDCKNWVENYLSENIDLAKENHTKTIEGVKYQYINFDGLSIYKLDERIYKVAIKPLEAEKSKFPIRIFGIQADWIAALKIMDFYDFLIFLKGKEISSSRLFDLNTIDQELIVKILNSGMIVQFSEINPHKFDCIFLHFNTNNSPLGFEGIPIF